MGKTLRTGDGGRAIIYAKTNDNHNDISIIESQKSTPVFGAWVGNLGKYAEGQLQGEWIPLPNTPERIEALYKQIGLDEQYEEYYISEYDIPIQWSSLQEFFSEYSNLEDLNMVAHLLEEEQPDPEALMMYLESKGNLSLEEIGNIVVQHEEIPFFSYDFEGLENCSNMDAEEKYGYTVTYQNGTYAKLQELDMVDYVDFGAIGRDDSLSGYVSLGENGYINKTDQSVFLDLYSRDELYERAGLVQEQLQLQEENKVDEVTVEKELSIHI